MAVGSLAIVSSAIMYTKIRSLEAESDRIYEQARKKIEERLNESGLGKDAKQVQFVDDDDGTGVESHGVSTEARIG